LLFSWTASLHAQADFYKGKTVRMKTMSDPELLAEAEKRKWEAKPVSGEKLEASAREVVTQPPEVIGRMNVVLGK
jgi:hypothetical protein